MAASVEQLQRLASLTTRLSVAEETIKSVGKGVCFSKLQKARFDDLLIRLKTVESKLGTGSNSHYDTLGATYEKAFFYEAGEYNEWMLMQLSKFLKFEGECRFADVGGGTGHIASALAQAAGFSPSLITVVEPSSSMAAQAEARNINTEVIDAVTWADSPANIDEKYHRVLLKEMIHHVPIEKRSAMWSSLFTNMISPGGIVCIVTRPKDDIDYPFFKAAHEVWVRQSSPVSDLTTDLQRAGFQDIQAKLLAFPCSISVDRWLDMVKNRFWSTFDSFDDASLELGCAEIKAKYEGQPHIKFEDRIYFVTALKPTTV